MRLSSFASLFMILSALWPALLQGQTREIVDVGSCIITGLKNNFGVRISRNYQSIAENNVTWGNAGYLPEVTMTNRFGGTINTTTQNPVTGESATSKGIHNTSGSAGLNLAMTLFRGFQVQTNWQKLQELEKVGQLNARMSMENLVADVASEYYYFVEQVSLYRNLAYAVTLSRERMRIDEQRYLLGASSKLDLLQSIVYFNADSSRLDKQKEVLRAAQVRLNELMASEDPGKDIFPRDTGILINEALKYQELIDATLQQNTSLLIASRNKVISSLDYKIIKSQAYPYLTASTGYSYSYSGYEAYTLRNQQVRGMNYGVTLGFDIFDGYNKKRQQANAWIEMENREYQYREIEQAVKADLITIFYAYENNIRLLRLEEQNLSVARENLEIATVRYKLGNLSGIEYREVQKSLLDAEERLISVKYLTKIAEISLMQISGKVMDLVQSS